MPAIEVNACAKLNLTLDVLRRREDGYHDLRSVMLSVALSDTVTVESGGDRDLVVSTNMRFLPNDTRNLAAVAARRFRESTGRGRDGLAISIRKRIPICAGMGGGSSDAAAVLHALNTLTGAGLSAGQLAEIGNKVGSDVPYCILGGTALAEGRGELLTPLPPLPACHIVLCKPKFYISTPELFARVNCTKLRRRPDTAGVIAALAAGNLGDTARRLYNVFEDVLSVRHAAEIIEIKNLMICRGALGASMSGTGPTVFGIFEDLNGAEEARTELKKSYTEVFLTKPV